MSSILQKHTQLYFLHIEKTGGLSLTDVLDNGFSFYDVCPYHHWEELISLSEHDLAKYHFFRGHFTYALHTLLPEKPAYITMLREPVQRVISHYHHARDNTHYYLTPYLDAKNLSLLDFMQDPLTSHVVTNWQTRCIAFDIDLKQIIYQHSPSDLRRLVDDLMTSLPEDELLDIAKQRIDEFAFVGIMERFKDSLALLTDGLDWTPTAWIPHVNKAPKTLASDILSQVTRDVILEHNQLDIALYQYAYQQFDKHFQQMLSTQSRMESPASFADAVDQIDYTFDQPLAGGGWYWRERGGEKQFFRWTGASDTTFIQFSLKKDKDLLLELYVFQGMTSEMLTGLVLTINNIPILLTHQIEQDRHLYRGYISAACLQGTDEPAATLVISTPPCTSPSQLGISEDRRSLGVAVERIVIYPTEHT